MNLREIKFRQPVVGDSRCALYSLANLLNDRAFLLMNNVNEMTDHGQEISFLKKWSALALAVGHELSHINHLEFHAGIFNNGRLYLQDLNLLDPIEPETFYAGLIDYRLPGKDYAHTVGFLWPQGESFIVIDPQKNYPKDIPKARFFSLLEVVGFRILAVEGENEFCSGVAVLNKESFSHIFISESEAIEAPETSKTVLQ